MDRFLTKPYRDIGGLLKKMNLECGDSSLLESFLQIVRHCRRLKDIVDDSDYFEYLQKNYHGEKCLEPILALFNLIYSSYTVDGEASVHESAKLIASIRKSNQQLEHYNDIELYLLSISTSFREMTNMMQQSDSKSSSLEEVFKDILLLDLSQIKSEILIQDVVEAIYQDFKKLNPKTMDCEDLSSKLETLNRNSDSIAQMCTKLELAPTFVNRMNLHITQDYEEQVNICTINLLTAFKVAQKSQFGKDALNLSLIHPIELELYGDSCLIRRYDLQNQVNFAYLDIKYNYLSHLQSINVLLIGARSQSTEQGKSPICMQETKVQYTNQFQIQNSAFK